MFPKVDLRTLFALSQAFFMFRGQSYQKLMYLINKGSTSFLSRSLLMCFIYSSTLGMTVLERESYSLSDYWGSKLSFPSRLPLLRSRVPFLSFFPCSFRAFVCLFRSGLGDVEDLSPFGPICSPSALIRFRGFANRRDSGNGGAL